MPAYWIARAKVNLPDEYAKYAQRVPAILDRFGGKVLARGGDFRVLEGTDLFHRFVVVEFPSLDAAVRCHASEDYQAAARFRGGEAGLVDLVIVEGVKP